MIAAKNLTFEVVRRPGPRLPARYDLLFRNNSEEFLEAQIEGDARKSGEGIVARLSFGLHMPKGSERTESFQINEDHDAFDVVFAYRPGPQRGFRAHSGIKARNTAS